MSRKVTTVIAILCAVTGCAPDGPGAITEPEVGTRWMGVGAGTYFSCGVTTTGVPACWGFYSAAPGQGGDFALTGVPVPVPGTISLRSVSVGGGVACGLDEGGRAYCWGREHFGELGNGGSTNDSTRVPVPVQGGLTFASIDVGYSHVCAVTRAGVGYCWGENGGGALGNGTRGPGTQRGVPSRVVGELTFKSITAGTTQTCGVTAEGVGYCWGGGFGSAGISAPDSTSCRQGATCFFSTPQRISAEPRFASISAGNGFTCGVAIGGVGYCWGGLFEFDPSQRTGVLGSGSTSGSLVPVPVAGGLKFATIETGTRAACGLTPEGAAYCWGGNSSAELGIGGTDERPHPTPEAVRGGLQFQQLSLGEASCGVTRDENLFCWGTTYGGLLGNGETRGGVRAVPTRVADLPGR